uniref:Uncharacterized protein n=1 Tax=Zea mays TaxID=4577 RepID=A0A804PIJ8_MAIZE
MDIVVEEGNVDVGNTAEPSYEVVARSGCSAQLSTKDTNEHELAIEREDSKVSVGNAAKQSHDVVGVGIDCIFNHAKVSTEADLGPQPDVIHLTSLHVPNESSQISSDADMVEQNKQDALDTLIRISQHKKPKKLNVARVVSEDYKCTPEDVQLIEYIKTLPGKQVVVDIDSAWLNRNDMECLFHGDIQLSGEALSAYIHCIRDEEHLLHREGGKVFLENTFISSLLKRDGDPKDDITMFRFKLPAILWDSRLNTKKGHQNLDHNVDEDGESSSDVQIIDTPYCFNMAVRMIACNDALFLLEDKYHYMDLQFCVVQSNLNQCNNEDILLSGTEIEMESYEQESSDSSDEEWSTLSTPRKTKLQGNEKVSLTESVRSAKRCSRRAPAREQNNEHTQSEQLHGSASEQQAREQLHGSISKWFSATRHYSRVAVAKNQKYPGENTTENNSSAIFDGIQVIEPNFGLIDKPDADTNDMISEKLMVQINLNEGIEEDIPPSQYTTRCEEKLTMTQAAISREAGPPGYDPGENFLQAVELIDAEIAQSFSQQRKQREGGGPTYHETFAYAQGPFARVPEAYDFVHVWHPHNQNVGATCSGLSGVATVSSTLGVLRAYSPNSTSASSSNLSTVHMGGLTCITQPTTELGSEDTVIAQFLSNPAQVGPSESPVLFSEQLVLHLHFLHWHLMTFLK